MEMSRIISWFQSVFTDNQVFFDYLLIRKMFKIFFVPIR